MDRSKIAETPLTENNKKNGWRLAFTILSMGLSTILVVGGFATMLSGVISYNNEHDDKVLLIPIITGSIALLFGVLSFFIDNRYTYLNKQLRYSHDNQLVRLEEKLDHQAEQVKLQSEIIKQQSSKIELLEKQNKILLKEVDELNHRLEKYNTERDSWD